MNKRISLSALKFCQSWIACILAMNGGISIYHATVAAKTGGIGAVGVLVTSFLPNAYQNWKSNLVLTFGTTFIGDIIVVPTHYGPVWMEALVTGLIASTFAGVTIYVRHQFRRE